MAEQFILPLDLDQNNLPQETPKKGSGLILPLDEVQKPIIPATVSLGEVNESQYDVGKPITVSQEDWRGQEQGRLAKVANGAGRFMSKFGLEVNKGFAYAVALGDTALTDTTLPESMDNAFLRAAELSEENIKEILPIYLPKDVREGNLWDNITSTSFYTS
jgi:hypothetical protein